MIYGYNKDLVKNAKELRKNMTDEEKRLWYDFLKKLPITVNRQKNIGNYIVDFYIASKRVVIELDGAQHEMLVHEKKDEVRDAELNKLGITVLRYKNLDIRYNFKEVCEDILKHIDLTAEDLKP
ncbi:MAG: endonuclease domain-containing protein [Ruminococcaceae bacterium]|nr:endonuclease domain-containing protein [Oscillospiraceae bacterium]